MKNELLPYIVEAVRIIPQVRLLLSDKALSLIDDNKSIPVFSDNIRRLIVYLYSKTTEEDDTARNIIITEIFAAMLKQISDHIYDAYFRAWRDEEEVGGFPDYLFSAWHSDVENQKSFIGKFLLEVAIASAAGLPIEPFLLRVDLWSNRWNESYNKAIALIAENNGGNLVWKYGETEHCDTCLNLNNIIASAKDWSTAGVKPQNAPNPLIDCGGWNCQCSLERTSERRSAGALDRIMSIIGKA